MPCRIFGRGRSKEEDVDDMDEKRAPKPRRWLIFLIILNRVWQSVYAMAVYASAMYLVLNEKAGLGAQQKRTQVIEGLVRSLAARPLEVYRRLLTCW